MSDAEKRLSEALNALGDEAEGEDLSLGAMRQLLRTAILCLKPEKAKP